MRECRSISLESQLIAGAGKEAQALDRALAIARREQREGGLDPARVERRSPLERVEPSLGDREVDPAPIFGVHPALDQASVHELVDRLRERAGADADVLREIARPAQAPVG